MARAFVIGIVVCSLIFLSAQGVHASHHIQEGEGSDCLDFYILRAVPGVYSPFAKFVTVTEGYSFAMRDFSGFDITIWLNFFDAAGNSLGTNDGDNTGIVPAGATVGTICLNGITGTILLPPDTKWQYTECVVGPCQF